ncbi:TRAP transporter small permease subunit [Lutimaribacter sp. EGI FJ00015]|uniref:TRAP transporter small permease subunit n=1 Tax=Lutimaribacter degradans TaxID=2945989 RepID=A0ACC5ZS50_9RHOB|nr:TRAP transporter small permease subunit [Lutimaribacter sp. EGI FJ00013]MCM2560763.1 TRAP transporter small permease subunit [Lutimaribacter sp. EGI FJ00013]MCO0612291.1 TRAP transporter small permease subunit [Lutimaribacter sp. EGI FJ00015]MCO0634588.1 TRAP transporter small permease subunit [Lutimaribacter sp. EGI FJ00014]
MTERDGTGRNRFGFAGVLRGIAAFAVISLLFAQIVIVALRYVFSIGAPWATDLLTYLFFFIVSLPLAAVLLYDESVRVDVFNQRFPPAMRRVIDRIALLGLLFPAMSWAAWKAVPMVQTSWRVLESSPTLGGLPGFFILKTITALVFVTLAVVSLILGLRPSLYGKDTKT